MKLDDRRWHLLAIVTAATVAAIAAWQLFGNPSIGIADNRDFWRLMWPNGLGYPTSPEATIFKWTQLKLVFGPPTPIRYLTTEQWFVTVALWLARRSHAEAFDLRLLGAVHLVAYSGAIGLFVAAHEPRSRPARLAVALLTVLMFADVRLVAYFNSLYSESASLIFAVWVVALALLSCAQRTGATAWLGWLGFLGASVAFALAKPQNLAFVPPLALCAYALVPTRGLERHLGGGIAALALASLPIVTLATGAYGETTRVNVQVHLDEELLRNSPTPTRDLAELGVRGRDYAPVTFGTLARFYLRHPARWWALAQRGANAAFSWIPYGNYERSVGKPPFANDERFGLWSRAKQRFAPHSLPLLIIMTLALAACWLHRALRGVALADRLRAFVSLMLLAGAVAELIVTVTFEANGVAKHLFIFNVVVDVLLLLVVADVVDAVVASRTARRIGRRDQPLPSRSS